jgi:hypothetical protein
MGKIEGYNTAKYRNDEIREWLIMKGVSNNQLEIQSVNIGCLVELQKKIEMGTADEFYIDQRRLDIKIVRR